MLFWRTVIMVTSIIITPEPVGCFLWGYLKDRWLWENLNIVYELGCVLILSSCEHWKSSSYIQATYKIWKILQASSTTGSYDCSDIPRAIENNAGTGELSSRVWLAETSTTYIRLVIFHSCSTWRTLSQ